MDLRGVWRQERDMKRKGEGAKGTEGRQGKDLYPENK